MPMMKRYLIPVLSLLLLLSCQERREAPAVLWGGEMHNSNASTPESIDASLELAAGLGFNAVLAPVSWELLESVQGEFDFTLVDYLLEAADKRNLYLGLLWFGTWKNGESSYPPLWVKSDTATYFRAPTCVAEKTGPISPFCEAACEADSRAFQTLMTHLKKADVHRRVLCVQVENEVGVFAERDFSAAGMKAWEESPWSRSDDPLAPQYFMAEAYARYVDAVAAAGKEAYDLPLFTNAWLADADKAYGKYPNGGPRVAVLDIWKKNAPHLDWLSPDIYGLDLREMCAAYADGQPLFIPETNCKAGRCWYALGEAGAKGVFGFGYEEHFDDPYYTAECKVISEMMPLIAGGHPMRGFVRIDKKDAPDAVFELPLGDCTFCVHCIDGEKNAHGIIVQTAPDEFTVAGVGAWIDFGPSTRIAFCEELRDGKRWQVLNGDETGHHNMLYLRGRLSLEDDETSDGTLIPAPFYGLSYQRRFRPAFQERFKVSGIYRIKLYDL